MFIPCFKPKQLFRNIQTLLDFHDLPEGNITVDTYDTFLIERYGSYFGGIAERGLTNCSVEANLDDVSV